MGFELRIFIVDLIAFAPQDGFMWALLLNSPKETMSSDHKPIAAHHPVLILPTDGENQGQWTDIKSLLKLNDDKDGYGWLLNQEDVIVEANAEKARQPGPLPPPPKPPDALLPNGTNRTSFGWVPKISDVSPKSGPLDKNLLDTVPPEKVIARLKLDLAVAALEAFEFGKLVSDVSGDREIVPFRFVMSGQHAPAGLSEKALADVMVARFQVKDDKVTIRSRKYDTNATPRDPIELVNPGGDDPVVEMLLANISPNGTEPDKDNFGRHFELYYGLTITPNVIGPVPLLGIGKGEDILFEPNAPSAVLQMEEDDEGVGALNRPICTFAQF